MLWLTKEVLSSPLLLASIALLACLPVVVLTLTTFPAVLREFKLSLLGASSMAALEAANMECISISISTQDSILRSAL